MLNHKEVLEALLAGKVLRDIDTKEFIRYLGSDGELRDENKDIITDLELYNWEIIPETITINGIEVPRPEYKAPTVGTTYFMPSLDGADLLYVSDEWECCLVEYQSLKRGLIHLSKENAIAHAKALLSFTENCND